VPSIGSRDVACAERPNIRRFEHFLQLFDVVNSAFNVHSVSISNTSSTTVKRGGSQHVVRCVVEKSVNVSIRDQPCGEAPYNPRNSSRILVLPNLAILTMAIMTQTKERSGWLSYPLKLLQWSFSFGPILGSSESFRLLSPVRFNSLA